jgi:hypothetical protein
LAIGTRGKGFGKITAPDAGGAAVGTGVPGNEGVGEHVRARFQPGFGPGEIAEQRSAPNEENLFLLPDRFSKERTLLKERSSRLT